MSSTCVQDPVAAAAGRKAGISLEQLKFPQLARAVVYPHLLTAGLAFDDEHLEYCSTACSHVHLLQNNVAGTDLCSPIYDKLPATSRHMLQVVAYFGARFASGCQDQEAHHSFAFGCQCSCRTCNRTPSFTSTSTPLLKPPTDDAGNKVLWLRPCTMASLSQPACCGIVARQVTQKAADLP
jgi:hypothetical protein